MTEPNARKYCVGCKYVKISTKEVPCIECLHAKERLHYKPAEATTERPPADNVNHPAHYTRGMECIDEMILIFGEEATMNFCLLNAWKYRKRAIFKNGEEDIQKSDWYLAKYKELSR